MSTLRCPHCQGSLEYNPQLAGRVVACPHCSRHFQMPAMATPAAAPAARPAAAVPAKPAKRSTRRDEEDEDSDEFSLLDQRRKVAAPSTCLMIYGGLSGVFVLLNLMIYLSGVVPLEIPPDPAIEALFEPSSLIGIHSLLLLKSAVVFYGGWKMMELDGVIWPTVAALLLFVPDACCCLGVPLGIWSVFLILDSKVNFAMRMRSTRPR